MGHRSYGVGEHEKHDLFQKKKETDRHLACNHGGKTRDRQAKKKKGHFHAFVDTARFAGGARSLERRAVTGA
jgi:hypothetical protein